MAQPRSGRENMRWLSSANKRNIVKNKNLVCFFVCHSILNDKIFLFQNFACFSYKFELYKTQTT